jgi:hypothetical protein
MYWETFIGRAGEIEDIQQLGKSNYWGNPANPYISQGGRQGHLYSYLHQYSTNITYKYKKYIFIFLVRISFPMIVVLL